MTHYSDGGVTLHHGDCLDILRELPDNSVDSVVTDPPYGLEFMGREWDGADGFRRSLNANDAGRDNAFGRTSRTSPEYRTTGRRASHLPACFSCECGQGGEPVTDHPAGPDCLYDARVCAPGCAVAARPEGRLHTFQEWCEAWARECLRVLKPGGHLLAFGGTRTSHRLACAVEDAGFEIRDSIAWLYGSGFPKSLDVSKAIDKAAGAEREVVGRYTPPNGKAWNLTADESAPGYSGGLGLRSEAMNLTAPATDDARTWQGWGTALKPAHEPIVVARKPLTGTVAANVLGHGTGALNVDGCRVGDDGGASRGADYTPTRGKPNAVLGSGLDLADAAPRVPGLGRWPANVVLDESQAEALDAQSGSTQSRIGAPRGADNGEGWGMTATGAEYDDQGGASRFFYVAKADASERVRVNGTAHPTVKPLALMRWLVRLVTPPGGTVLEPFAGSGTTVEACIREGFRCVAIEREADYLPLILKRIERGRGPNVRARSAAPPDLDDSLLSFLETDQETA